MKSNRKLQKQRLRKQQLKERKERERQKKQAERVRISEKRTSVSSTVPAQPKKKSKYEQQKALTQWKFEHLVALGIDPYILKVSVLRKVKKKDIETGNINPDTYPFLFPNGFDFEKRYFFKDELGWFIMFLDYTGESTIEELLYRFALYSNKTLIEFLDYIVHAPKTGTKNKGSSGRAGIFRSMLTSENIAERIFETENKKLDNSFNNIMKRVYKGNNRFWQCVGQDGKKIITNISGRETLIILNALMYNCLEDYRDLYGQLYRMLTNCFDDFKKFLPEP